MIRTLRSTTTILIALVFFASGLLAQQSRGTLRGGNLSSPFFGQSLSVNQYGGFGPSGSSGAGNRRVFAQLRLSF